MRPFFDARLCNLSSHATPISLGSSKLAPSVFSVSAGNRRISRKYLGRTSSWCGNSGGLCLSSLAGRCFETSDGGGRIGFSPKRALCVPRLLHAHVPPWLRIDQVPFLRSTGDSSGCTPRVVPARHPDLTRQARPFRWSAPPAVCGGGPAGWPRHLFSSTALRRHGALRSVGSVERRRGAQQRARRVYRQCASDTSLRVGRTRTHTHMASQPSRRHRSEVTSCPNASSTRSPAR